MYGPARREVSRRAVSSGVVDPEREVIEPDRSRECHPVVDHRGGCAVDQQARAARCKGRELVEVDRAEVGERVEGVLGYSPADAGVGSSQRAEIRYRC